MLIDRESLRWIDVHGPRWTGAEKKKTRAVEISTRTAFLSLLSFPPFSSIRERCLFVISGAWAKGTERLYVGEKTLFCLFADEAMLNMRVSTAPVCAYLFPGVAKRPPQTGLEARGRSSERANGSRWRPCRDIPCRKEMLLVRISRTKTQSAAWRLSPQRGASRAGEGRRA